MYVPTRFVHIQRAKSNTYFAHVFEFESGQSMLTRAILRCLKSGAHVHTAIVFQNVVWAPLQVFLYEQLSNGTVFAHPLPIPAARDFSAADFDGDGDIDIMIIQPTSDSCLYFERRGDGSLEQLFGTDNPFNGVCQRPHGDLLAGSITLYASLGDWDGDDEKDLVVIDDFNVTLWLNRPLESFVEVIEKDSPFGKFRFSEASQVSLVDVNDDGRLDVVVPPQSYVLGRWRGYETYGYFKSGTNGFLVEQLGEANPFDKVAYNKTLIPFRTAVKQLIVDLDGDGDLDIVHEELQYTRNDGGHLTHLNPFDPDHPFRGVQDGETTCWTFVDWDRDGDLDLVQAYQLGGNSREEVRAHVEWVTTTAFDMVRNGTSRAERLAWFRKNVHRHMRLYLNAGMSFQEVTGSANPFHEIYLQLDETSTCPTFVDLDKDDVLELVFGTSNGNVSLFSHLSFSFWLLPLLSPVSCGFFC